MSRSPWIVENDDETLGYTEPVHKSLLEPILWGGVPYTPALGNFVLTIIVMVSFGLWRYAVIGAFLHGLMWLVTWGDAHRFQIAIRYFSYRAHYGTR